MITHKNSACYIMLGTTQSVICSITLCMPMDHFSISCVHSKIHVSF